jgi:hypothetical protein
VNIMTRRNIVLATLLVIQLGIVLFVFWPRGMNASAGPLVPELATDKITGVTVQDATNQVQLAKVDEQWVLPAADNYPVLAANVTRLISDALAIDTSRLVANTPASHGRLKVSPNDYVRRVELTGADGQRVTLYIGASPNVGTTHVRRDGQDAVYLTPAALSTDARTDLAGWIDTAYVQANPDEIQQIDVERDQEQYSLLRDPAGEWTLAGLAPGEMVQTDQANLLASRLATISLTKPLGKSLKPEYGLDQPQASITLTVASADGMTQTVAIAIGAEDEAGSAYTVKASTAAFYGQAPKFQLQDFVEKGRADLVTAPIAPVVAENEAISATLPLSLPAAGTGTAPGDAGLPSPVNATPDAAIAPTSPLTVTRPVTP